MVLGQIVTIFAPSACAPLKISGAISMNLIDL